MSWCTHGVGLHILSFIDNSHLGSILSLPAIFLFWNEKDRANFRFDLFHFQDTRSLTLLYEQVHKALASFLRGIVPPVSLAVRCFGKFYNHC